MSGELTKLQKVQAILGVRVDDVWGDRSQAALDAEIEASVRRRRGSSKPQAPSPPSDGPAVAGSKEVSNGENGEGNYSTRFLKMIPFLWEWEGTKFENDKADPGGATKFGIDKRSHPDEDIPNLTEARAIAIYWKEYWQRYSCENYAWPLGEVVFNCCVNAGAGRAAEILKKLPGGGASRSTLTPTGEAVAFLDEMAGFYNRLAKAKPKMRKFLKGWLNRTAALRKHLRIG